MKKELKDGSVLMTGKDMMDAFEKMYNTRNNFDKDCSFCKLEDSENDECEGCSNLNEVHNTGCSCHLNPPCSYCTDLLFEPSEWLLNYKHFRDGGKWKWECFKSNEKTFNKLSLLESKDLALSCETLTTGEITIYLDNEIDEENIDIEICQKKDFKKTVELIINRN